MTRTGQEGGARRLLEVVRVFSRFGLIAFGGPAVHLGMFEEEVVERRRWVDRQHFLDLVGATQLIPGPNSTEMTMHLGFERAGWRGLVAGGTCFILPAVLMSTALAWAYVEYGDVPAMEPMLRGIQPVVLAIIFGALLRLGKAAIKDVGLAALALVAAAASLAGLGPVTVLVGGGLLGMLARRWQAAGAGLLMVTPAVLAPGLGAQAAAGAVSMPALSWAFLEVGALLYGSGYVLVAFLRDSLVQGRGWLTEQQLLDAIAIGQFTPGPVLSTSAFIGYLVGGVTGAAVAAVSIFLPSFLFVAALNPVIPKLRQSAWTAAFLDAVNACAVALIAAVIAQLAWTALATPTAVAIAVAAAVTRTRFGASPMLLVIAGGLLGWALL